MTVVKMILGGFSAGSGDLFAMFVLWMGYSAFDFCQTVTYMILCLQEVFTIAVSFAFWVQKTYVIKEPAESTAKNTYSFIYENPLAKQEAKSGGFAQVNLISAGVLVFLGFYSVAVYLSFRAYKEYKGCLEDFYGGPEQL